MRVSLILAASIALTGCDAPFLPKGQDSPRWSVAQPMPVITERWADGFVPQEAWKADTLQVYGDGRWLVTRSFAPVNESPSVTVASGSIPPETLKGVLGKAFERPFMGQSFLDLPADVESQVMDAPVVVLSLTIDNASHSVTVSGPRPAAFTRFESAIASQTVSLPVMP